MVFFGNAAIKNGVTVDTVIPVIVSEHPQLRQALDYAKSVADHRIQGIIDKFNSLDIAERERLFALHKESLAKLSAGAPLEIRGNEEQRAAWQKDVMSHLFAANVRVVPGTFLMSRK